jgi:hypothetical protein
MGGEPRAGGRLHVLRRRLISTGIVRALKNAAQSGSVAGVTSKLLPAASIFRETKERRYWVSEASFSEGFRNRGRLLKS